MCHVGGTDGNCFDFRIIEDFVVVIDSLAAAVLFDSSVSAFRNDIAEILDFAGIICHVRGNVCSICNRTAADYGYLDLVVCHFDFSLFFCSVFDGCRQHPPYVISISNPRTFCKGYL